MHNIGEDKHNCHPQTRVWVDTDITMALNFVMSMMDTR